MPIFALAASMGVAITARGEPGDAISEGTYPADLASRPLTLPAGMLEIVIPVTMGVNGGDPASPLMLAGSIAYGASDALTLAAYTSRGVCTNGGVWPCPPNVDLNVLGTLSVLRVPSQQLALRLQGRVYRPSSAAMGTAGIDYKRAAGPFAIVASATFDFGLNQRDAGNRDWVSLAVTPMFQATRELAVFVTASATTALDPVRARFLEFVMIPAGVGALYALYQGELVRGMDVGGQFDFDNLFGSQPNMLIRHVEIFTRVRF